MNTLNRSKQIRFLRGLSSITRVMMEEGALRNYQSLIIENARSHKSMEEIVADDTFKSPFLHELRSYNKLGAQTRQQYFDDALQLVEANEEGILVPVMSADDSPSVTDGNEPEKEARVLILHCEGPVTRGGGACSYGSIDYRELLKEYANDESVVGMILCTDTPGGDSMAMYDFEDGMREWNAAGKRSIQLVDGGCYSAGEAMGCQCDYQVAVNPHDGFGCIGAMCSGFITPAGSENSITHERFLHVVAEQTPDKNAMWEKAANGDTGELQAWVSETAQDFLDMMKAHRPNVNAEHLTGKIYEASDVMGSLCDGIATFDDAINYCLTGETPWQSSATEGAPAPDEPEVIDPEDVPEEEPETPAAVPEASASASIPNPQQSAPTTVPDGFPSGNPQESTTTTVPDGLPSGNPQQTILTHKDMNLLQRIAAALGITDSAEAPAVEEQNETPIVNNEETPAEEPATPAEQPAAEPEGGVTTPATEEPAAPTAEAPAAPAAPAEQPAAAPEGGVTTPAPEEPAAPAAPAESEAVIGLRQQVADFESQVSMLQQKLTEQEATIKANGELLNEKDVKAKTDAQTITELQAKLTAVNEELASVKAILAECKSDIEAKEASISQLQQANTELTEQNALLKEVGAAPKTPAPAPAPAQEENDEPEAEFKPGEMTAQELIAIQKKKTARRTKKKAE